MRRLAIIAATGLLCTVGSPAAAQDLENQQKHERTDVHLRNDCRLAVQVLTLGQPANKREWALDVISRCDETGPPVLARMWRDVAADSASVDNLIYRSVYLRDRRLYQAVWEIARDRSVPARKRAAALHLLGRWAHPGYSLDYDPFFAHGYEPAEAYGGASGVRMRFIDHDSQYEGAEPLPATIKTDVLSIARDIAANDPDISLRMAARSLVRGLPR